MNEWASVVIAAFAAGASIYAVVKSNRKDTVSEVKEEAADKSEVSVQMTLMLGEIRSISATVGKIEQQTSRIEDRVLDHERRLVRIETLNEKEK